MSGWLDRFDGEMITVAELSRLDHRTRVACAYYGVVGIAARMSDYFLRSSGVGSAIRATELFITEGIIDGPGIAASRASLYDNFERLDLEGYDRHHFEMTAFLLSAVCKEEHLPAAKTAHLECDIGCRETAVACEWCQSSAGVVYTMVAQRLRGVGACRLPDAPLDEIMAQFFQFGRAAYSVLSCDPPFPLPVGRLPGVELGWGLPGPIEAEVLRTAWVPPPPQEDSRL